MAARLVLVLGLLGTGPRAFAQAKATDEPRNPFAGDPKALEQGRIQFRQWCALCHGREARGGVKGPDLGSGRFLHGGRDAQIYGTILSGAPGTQMPASDLSEEETWQIVTFLRSLQPPAPGRTLGDAKAGDALFWGEAKCGTCHMVGGRGGRRGPDLTRVGAARPAGFLAESIREPSRHITERALGPGADFGQTPPLYSLVTLEPRGGEEMTGLVVIEDNFTIVVMDEAEGLRSFRKTDLRVFRRSPISLMPAYDEDALGKAQLQDLLAYLDGLRGP